MDLWLDQARTFRQKPFAESVQRGETGTSFLKRKRPNRQSRLSPIYIGRDDWIRTSDPLTPSQCPPHFTLVHTLSLFLISCYNTYV